MAKRTLYAVAEMAAATAALAAGFPGSAVARASPGQNAVCVTCVAISIPPQATLALPQELGGLDVFVRVVPGAEGAALAALAEIERKGGRPGLLIEGFPDAAPPATLLARTRRILVAPGAVPAEQTEEAFAFALKTRLTAETGRDGSEWQEEFDFYFGD